ncbi:MAG: bifunctional transcriptional activator/DNA repair protein Ada [Armatimonadetes bacterium]|nr:bifunctional transcriptional activator/DNA repair protein Ada [Armatimonadota bacterium]
MYSAIATRDDSFVGIFFVAVKTTHVFCRPGCPARVPLVQNVEFFSTSSEALHAGYRPCKRCRPMDTVLRPPAWVDDLVSRVDRNPQARISDWSLKQEGLDPERVRRAFRRSFGMTFQAYCRARRIGLALQSVREGQDVFTTGLDHGYESDSGFRDAFTKILGAPPSKAGSARVLTCRWLETPLGPMLAVADERALYLLEFVDRRMLETQVARIRGRFKATLVPGANSVLDQTEQELNEYFEGKRTTFEVRLELEGTDFQETVWKELLRIPYGQTRSYQQVAIEIGSPNAMRAVGKANGDNRLAIIVPCHRVLAANGTLHGYGGGLWRKQRLLELESGQAQLL